RGGPGGGGGGTGGGGGGRGRTATPGSGVGAGLSLGTVYARICSRSQPAQKSAAQSIASGQWGGARRGSEAKFISSSVPAPPAVGKMIGGNLTERQRGLFRGMESA